MNVIPGGDSPIEPEMWDGQPMRHALAERDIGAVYRLLQRVGISQRRIAALTGQAQSDVADILKGRQVMAYDVLVRIADGLGIPRGYMGLAYDSTSTEVVAQLAGQTEERGSEEMQDVLALAAAITIGASTPRTDMWWQPVDRAGTPVPERVGAADVEQLEAVTQQLRAGDYRFGGGVCRDAVIALARWAQRLPDADAPEAVKLRLHLVLADLHNLAGWTSFDVGLYTSACRYFLRALEQARYANEASLIANILYRMGKLHLHLDQAARALRFFQLGQIAAQDAGCGLTVAMLCANEAWAYAELDDQAQAYRSLGRAEDEFARADHENASTWVRFFGSADLYATIGVVNAALPHRDGRRYTSAVDNLAAGLAARGPEMARSCAFEETALATVHLDHGDLDEGTRIGHRAVDMAERLRSIRVVDRLAPLERAAREHGASSDVCVLAERIATLRSR